MTGSLQLATEEQFGNRKQYVIAFPPETPKVSVPIVFNQAPATDKKQIPTRFTKQQDDD